jgi:hypothetical protein
MRDDSRYRQETTKSLEMGVFYPGGRSTHNNSLRFSCRRGNTSLCLGQGVLLDNFVGWLLEPVDFEMLFEVSLEVFGRKVFVFLRAVVSKVVRKTIRQSRHTFFSLAERALYSAAISLEASIVVTPRKSPELKRSL